MAVWNGTILGTGAQPGKRMFEASGLKAVRQEVEVDRPNAERKERRRVERS